MPAADSPSDVIVAPGLAILPTPVMAGPAATAVPDALGRRLDTVGSQASFIRGLYPKRPVARELITREQLASHVMEELDEDIEDVEESQRLYRTLGVMEPEVVLYDLLVELYRESVLGFYDSEEERLYVVQDADEITPRDILTYTHEFTHSLQQQHFDIHSQLEGTEGNSDERLAYRGLIEGDATISETLYMLYRLSEEDQEAARRAAEEANPDAFESVPHLIQRLFIFPYVEGVQFGVALFTIDNTWDAIDGAYESRPVSTEQILHPEKYHAGEEPLDVQAPDLIGELGDGWTEVTEDTMGEFFLRAYLGTKIPHERAAAAAEGWGGDRYTLLAGPEDRSLLASRVVWDTPDDAVEFHTTMLHLMELLMEGEWEESGPEDGDRVMVSSDRSIYLGVSDATSLLIIAPDGEALESARAALLQGR